MHTHNAMCMACGPDNPASLGFTVTELEPGRRMVAEVRFGVVHEGAPGRAHGGAIASALDEVLGQLASTVSEGDTPTAELTVRYVASAMTGDVCTVSGKVERTEGRKIWLHGELRRRGELLATAHGLWIRKRT